jgi:hypothetical protein
MNYSFITNLENPYIRRSLIVLMLAVGIPVILSLLLAEALWETAKAGYAILRNLIITVEPRILDVIEQIKEAW